MKISEIITEAKYRAPVVMYHGTSSVNIPGILKQGMLANTANKAWADDPHSSEDQVPRTSVGGSYWTDNISKARLSAITTVEKYPGNRAIVIAAIQTANALADEDNLTSDVNYALLHAIRSMIGVTREAVHAWAPYLYEPAAHAKMAQAFAQYLHRKSTDNAEKPVNMDLLTGVMDATATRIIAHYEADYTRNPGWKSSAFANMENKPEHIPSPAEADRNYLAAIDSLTRYYRDSAVQAKEWMPHSLRITSDIGFSGANKILAIVELPRKSSEPMIVRYGTIPAAFIQAWIKGGDSFPGAVDTQGNTVTEFRSKYE